MITMRPFNESDWYGFAGAESFPDGSLPLIGEIGDIDFDLDGTPVEADAVVVLDASGLSVMICEEHFGELAHVWFSEPYTARALAALRDRISFVELRAMPGAEVERSESIERLCDLIRT